MNNISASTKRAATVRTEYLEVGGVRYAYRELKPKQADDSMPIVCLHRFKGTLDDWDPGFVGELARNRHVILFSDRGVGTSTGDPASSVDEKADNAAEFIRALGYSQVDVLGFSMGCFIAQALAMNHPKLVRKAVLIGSGGGGNAETAPPTDIVFGIALRTDYTFEDVRYLFFAEGREAETKAYMERRASRTTDVEPPVTQAVIEKMVGLILEFMEGRSGHFARLKEVKHPVLIINGDRDPFFPAKNMFLLYRELANAQLLMYPNTGHGVHQQHPTEVADKIEYFLQTA